MKAHGYAVLLGLALSTTPLFGAPSSTGSATPPTPPPTSNYTNDWEKSGRVYTPPPNYVDSAYSGSQHRFYTGYVQSYRYRSQTIYFPPEAVRLGHLIPPQPRLNTLYGTNTSRSSVLALIAPYMAEFFYAPLSAHVHDEAIPNRLLNRISEYRQERLQVLSELRKALDGLRSAEAPRRKSELAALAVSMDARILALEAKAEDLRRSMVDGGLFAPSVDWNDTRSWRLGDDNKYESYQDEFLVMRASAYFQVGLSTSQRLLLREIASDLQMRGEEPAAEVALDAAGRYFSFSPFTSRFRLPSDLPEELEAKIASYRSRKAAIKQDLRETIYRTDRAWLDSTRSKAMADFNRRQQGEIEALEVLAEEIREGLADRKLPDEPMHGILGGPLGLRISAYLTEKGELQKSIKTKLAELKSLLPQDRIEIDHSDVGTRIVIEPSRSRSKDLVARRESARLELQNFNEGIAKEFQRLAEQRQTLRNEVNEYAVKHLGGRSGSVDQLMTTFARSFSFQDNWNRYSEYRTAVLEPGLSPAQRRLLYQASLESLLPDLAR